jgi:hypothetical protein
MRYFFSAVSFDRRYGWSALLHSMGTRDHNGLARLEAIRRTMDAVGAIALIHEAIKDTWRANRDRYEPDELHDDPLTRGVGGARAVYDRAARG